MRSPQDCLIYLDSKNIGLNNKDFITVIMLLIVRKIATDCKLKIHFVEMQRTVLTFASNKVG